MNEGWKSAVCSHCISQLPHYRISRPRSTSRGLKLAGVGAGVGMYEKIIERA